MELNISMITTGLNILSFQGVTFSNGDCVVSTLDGDLLRVSLDGAIAKWVNLARFGIPAGVADARGAAKGNAQIFPIRFYHESRNTHCWVRN
jgi:hypothetical protein